MVFTIFDHFFVGKLNQRVLLAPKKASTFSEIPSNNPLLEAFYGFQVAPVALKVV
jgi:hypothetical protein